jgi:hypothetical protein
MTAPAHLYIPTLCLDVALDPAAESRGAMVIPGNPSRVGWLTVAAPLDAEHGATVLAGHVNSSGRRGALWHLTAIRPGALVATTDAERHVTRWRVYAVEQVAKRPLSLTRTGPRELVVASCAGAVVRTASGGHYADNVLVHAVPEQRMAGGD